MAMKLSRCTECGKLIVGTDKLCKVCAFKQERNQDPFEVASMNLLRLIKQYHDVSNTDEAHNMLLEIDVALSHAYHEGYIDEDFYFEHTESLGLTRDWFKPKRLHEDSYYDLSDMAKEGFYYDMCNSIEEE